jgi:phenylpropionate dioxygenase-like ring-hydroxylating dioxygenase large terminal subunit
LRSCELARRAERCGAGFAHHGGIDPSPLPETSHLDNTSPALARGWHAVARAAEIGEAPAQVWLLGHAWVLARIDGRLRAFVDRCPHRLAPLSAGSILGDSLQCGYHGWRFAADGQAVAIPANGPGVPMPPRACLTPAAGVHERFGLVWLAPRAPVCDVHAFPEWDDPAYTRAETAPRRTPVSALQLADNFLDAAHFPTVHRRTFGTPEAAYVSPHHVTRDGWEIRTVYEAPYRNHDDPLVATGEHPLVQPHVLTKVGRPPASVYLTLDFPLTGHRLAILFVCQPETATSTRVYKLMAHNRPRTTADVDDLVAYEDLVLDEDLAILERYPSMTLATDPRREVHTAADKLSVAYRRVLADLEALETRS